MPIDFPNSPSINDLFSADVRTWRWTGTVWEAVATGPTGPNNLYELSDVNVTGATDGEALIYDVATGKWIPGEAGGSFIVSVTAPTGPSPGDVWFDSETGVSLIYYDDGNSQQWVEIGDASGPIGPTGPIGSTGPLGPPGLHPVFSRQGSLAITTGTQRLYVERNGTISVVRGSVGTPSSGAPILIDVLKNGTTVLTSLISIAEGSYTATGTISNTSVSIGDYFTVNITQVGATNPGANLTVTLEIL